MLNVIANSTQNISVISFQTKLNVIGESHSRQYLILPENWFQTVLNVIREFIPNSHYFYRRNHSRQCFILSENQFQTEIKFTREWQCLDVVRVSILGIILGSTVFFLIKQQRFHKTHWNHRTWWPCDFPGDFQGKLKKKIVFPGVSRRISNFQDFPGVWQPCVLLFQMYICSKKLLFWILALCFLKNWCFHWWTKWLLG